MGYAEWFESNIDYARNVYTKDDWAEMTDAQEVEMLRGWLAEALGAVQECRDIGYGDLLPDLEEYLVVTGSLTQG